MGQQTDMVTVFLDRPKYDKKFSRDREDLRTGQEVLRRTQIREQSGKGRPEGAADHPDGG